MSTWKTLPLNEPADQEEVWVRVKYYYSAPFLATYDEATETFISTVNLITYPAWSIARWKSK